MAAQPIHDSPHQDVASNDTVPGPTSPGVKAVDNRTAPRQVASPAHALQARIASELSKPSGRSRREILATLLVLSLSTWLAGFILYAAL